MQPVAEQTGVGFRSWVEEQTGIKGARLGPLLIGGNANVTRLIESDDGRFVLRHPPVHAVSDRAAAGISREYAALKALHGQAPVPRPIAWCDDRAILGQSFAVVEWLDGVALSTDLPDAYAATGGTDGDVVSELGREMIRGLALVHKADVRGRLPEKFGHAEGFVGRQVARWLDQRHTHKVRELPLLDEISRWLLDHQPECAHASLIHCDFHLDNCLVKRTQPRLVGILDWEMATLGDPLIDLGLCLFFWKRDPAQPLGFGHVQSLTNRDDVMSAEALADLWSDLTGFDHGSLTYYKVFAAWRLAAIVEGAYILHRQGQDDRPYARNLEHDVPNLLREAAAHIDRKGV